MERTAPATRSAAADPGADRRPPLGRGAVLLTWALLQAASAAAAGHSNCARLNPVRPDLAEFQELAPYYLAVRERLLGRTDSGLTVVVLPSFENEWGLRIARDRGAGFVVLASMQGSLWGPMESLVEARHISEAEALRIVAAPPTTTKAAPLSVAAVGK